MTQIEEVEEEVLEAQIAEVQVAEDDEVEVIVGKWFIRLSSRIDFLGFLNKKIKNIALRFLLRKKSDLFLLIFLSI